ncbi:GNAT family N-acetyltransferase [Catellatospora sp. KI3]|uniref:GNAT family N-acetyltransferase n=1 Tax=Catellatospora sp. KI3 TaxID=3041620 RepID=UPI00248259CD|nr:GNAT family N-acetyltransferase [Catellatospora sp. KI3]MDI1460766.1 GNAT family N-acetyltransferase [Catellatospora sp. KI3]
MSADDCDGRIAEAEAGWAKAAAQAGTELRELTEIGEVTALADRFTEIWGSSVPMMSGELLRAMSKAGSYVVGAYADGQLIGGCVAFHEAPRVRALHSHIAGVLPGRVGRGVGYALKLHQRAWALHRGIAAIEWTYDPLVARNAYFNIAKLGARPVEYLTNFYGRMNDAINGFDDSDRVLVRWDLLSPAAVAACTGRALPVVSPSERAARVALPADIEAMRAGGHAEARAWRVRVRDGLQPLLSQGWRVAGFDRTAGYHLEPPTPMGHRP